MLYKAAARQIVGQKAENIALAYLQQQGLSFITRNFSCRLGEIDLIMCDKTEVVFVEVRARTHMDGYDPIDSIHCHKQQRLLRTGLLFLQKKGWLETYPCRFDVIGITYSQQQPLIRWIKQAFSL